MAEQETPTDQCPAAGGQLLQLEDDEDGCGICFSMVYEDTPLPDEDTPPAAEDTPTPRPDGDVTQRFDYAHNGSDLVTQVVAEKSDTVKATMDYNHNSHHKKSPPRDDDDDERGLASRDVTIGYTT